MRYRTNQRAENEDHDGGQEAEHEREMRRNALLEEARRIAIERYLERWLASFAGLSKKGAWRQYTGGSGYPALGTFYSQVRLSGTVSKYLESCFRNEFEGILKKLEISDADVNELMAERSRVGNEALASQTHRGE